MQEVRIDNAPLRYQTNWIGQLLPREAKHYNVTRAPEAFPQTGNAPETRIKKRKIREKTYEMFGLRKKCNRIIYRHSTPFLTHRSDSNQATDYIDIFLSLISGILQTNVKI